MKMRYTYIAYRAAIKKQLESNIMKKSENWLPNTETDGGAIIETDSMGREKFWEDLGRPNE